MTSKPQFITLTDVSGSPELVNAACITRVWARGEGGSRVAFLNEASADTYRETPEQIAALLGVTKIDISPLHGMVDALGAAEWATDEHAAEILRGIINEFAGPARDALAAIASATGTEGA
ncbi:hypothetical protein ACW7BJ_16220 [Azospirillum argentinense]